MMIQKIMIAVANLPVSVVPTISLRLFEHKHLQLATKCFRFVHTVCVQTGIQS